MVDPTTFAEILIRVNVNRNPNSPTFAYLNRVFNISEDQSTKQTFGAVSATDIDTVCQTHECLTSTHIQKSEGLA